MTKKSDELMKLFGQLFQRRGFVGAALASNMPESTRQYQNERGPMRILQLLEDKGELTNTAISEAFDIRPSSVSALISQLEEVNMVERHSSTEDKRVSLISLTAAGRKTLHAQDEYKNTAFSGLSDEEVDQLIANMRKMLAAMPAEDDNWSRGGDWSKGWNHNWKQSQRGGQRPMNPDAGPEGFAGHRGRPFGFDWK
ncbi:MarR family winged helix-turn-helix transcriptional regulator [Loigolactobacillus backii]|uniref:MarR family winged helix-turn-helix transcriptional regulator n=1 Tax=Loigolactobacillus backii TaxID=375175 RepID=UPI0022FD37B7|nr:MarR family winged helix-turn-helix transcriptional regulator [Loigolactobacillus backii]MDA5388799.1 MarR family winged helix-turn-helix transcriptional regulator [Loigolactobacillus backii]MDA5391284.1 MarR family winged helix-turn-helix transcriptional regulator [Loigolactobacillus backii]